MGLAATPQHACGLPALTRSLQPAALSPRSDARVVAGVIVGCCEQASRLIPIRQCLALVQSDGGRN
eukprot:2851519-Pyramimonas_sp.AAC.1